MNRFTDTTSSPGRSGRKPAAAVLGLFLLLSLQGSIALAGEAPDRLTDSLAKMYEDTTAAGLAFGSNATLDDYLAYAAANSPALKAAFYRWQAAAERTGHAGALPDPVFSYSYFIENVETRVGPQEHRLSLKQAFPWFGTLGARKDMAAQQAKAAYAKYQSEKLKLFYRVKAAYYDYYFIGRDLDLTRENLVLLTFWESVVRTRYKVALSQHPDVIKAQVELGELEDRVLSLEDRLAPARARLRAALGASGTVPLPIPTEVKDREVELDRQAVIDRALSDNPDLAAVLHEIDKQRAAVRLAGKASRPDFSLGIDYIATGEALSSSMSESGKDPWMVSVGVSLPIWFGKNKSQRDEAAASLRQARYDFEDQRNRLAATAENILFEYADALRQTRLYRNGLVPKAEQALKAGFTAYEAGDVEFLSLLDAQRQLLAFERRLERARADLAIRQAEIEMITGRDITELAHDHIEKRDKP